MKIQFAPFTEERVPAVKDFNRRLGSATPNLFPESPVSDWLPKAPGRKIYEEYFLALEGDTVRGGYILKPQSLSLGGEVIPAAVMRVPISEGIVNKAYLMVGIQVVRDALRQQPLIFATGMGGEQAGVSKILKAMKWRVQPLPFYFKPKHAYRFARNLTAYRKKLWPRLALDVAAFTGLAWVGVKMADWALTRNRPWGESVSVETIDGFCGWADELWETCKDRYSLIALRDSAVLNLLYPPGDSSLIRLRVREGSNTIGWAVVLDISLSNHEKFGNLRAGLILDCLAVPEDAGKVMWAACRLLERRGVDFIRSHQSHPSWCAALKDMGFLRGTSLFLFAASPALAQKLDRVDPQHVGMHLNRGDGDGAGSTAGFALN